VALTVSPAIKIFALIGVLAAVLLGGGMFLLAPAPDDTSFDEPIVLPKKKSGVLELPKVAEETAAKAQAAVTARKGVLKPKAEASLGRKTAAAPKAKPKPKPVVASNGLPMVLVSALAANPVVVVALFDDAAKVDPLARDEAEAGAKIARAGFVALDVTRHQKAAEALLIKLGIVLRAPAVLVYTRPDVFTIKLDGFRDRDTVAQAALNAAR
jgi:hypothetical protein